MAEKKPEPKKPAPASKKSTELSDEELSKVSGGTSWAKKAPSVTSVKKAW